jgi:hypothetical protein
MRQRLIRHKARPVGKIINMLKHETNFIRWWVPVTNFSLPERCGFFKMYQLRDPIIVNVEYILHQSIYYLFIVFMKTSFKNVPITVPGTGTATLLRKLRLDFLYIFCIIYLYG